MRLAADEISIAIGKDRVVLRPTLRAALRLERCHGGFTKLFRAIADGNLGACADLIREAADRPTSIPDVLEALGTAPLRVGLDALTAPLLAFVLQLAGVDPDGQQSGEEKAEGERITFAEHFEKLFSIATGWLGWSPDDAWNATPAEILAAHKGRVEMLQAVFGGGSKGAGKTADLPPEVKFRNAMSAVGVKVVRRSKGAPAHAA